VTRTDDLAHPRLGQPIDLLNRVGRRPAKWFVNLESPTLVVAAMKKAGLPDIDVGPIAEPLEILSRSLDREADLHPLGRIAARTLLVGLLTTRARVRQLTADHPEITSAPVAAPIVIMGMPRTGTTFLQRLLSRDPGLRSLPYWEAFAPLPTGPADDRRAPIADRVASAEKAIKFLDRVAPDMKAVHELDATEPDEEIWLLGVALGSMLFEAQWNVPAYAEWYDSADLQPAYDELHTLLQVLQWYRPADRWLLKSPQHLERIPELRAAFPDAVIVQTHRDPVSVVASTASMISYSRRMSSSTISPPTIGRYWAWRIERLLTRSMEQRDATGTPVVDVRFEDLMADPLSIVEEIYRAADRQLSDQARDAMGRYLSERPRGHFGAHVYDLSDFGLDSGTLGATFSDYSGRFGLSAETG
jgi:hypothetical protein